MIGRNGSELEFDERKVENLLLEIFNKYGYDFRNYSRASVVRRIKRFLAKNNVSNIEELQSKILNTSSFFEYFLEEFTVNVTEMFRDPSFYLALRQNVLPFLSTYPYIRIWDAGCSSGEELFSLAILLKEENMLHRSKLYATDINHKILQQAREGIFSIQQMAQYTKNYLAAGGKSSFSEYYKSSSDAVTFDNGLLKNVIFYPHNLATDSSFNEFNLIICRNVLIYFNKALQEKVIKLFVDSLVPFGFVGLGKKETLTLSIYADYFESTDKEEKIFKKITL